MGLGHRLKLFILGHPLNPFNPNILRHVSLIALLAWVGLGADGLSSACYGPEEAYLALGSNTHLAVFIAAAMAITVFIISLGYNQVIELFPSGGGGYKVATQLLGSYIGLISGAALMIDYILTIAVSTASGLDALFSLLPPGFYPYKLYAESLTILLFIGLNLRGMKESIKFLLPIFIGFFVIHVGLILYGVLSHTQGLLKILPDTWNDTKLLATSMGWLPLVAILLHAYSLGSGTYTGLEAVSNNVNRLAEPRVTTGKWTMFYMAVSLSFTAAGFILLYLLWDAKPLVNQTLNAVVFHSILGDSWIGKSVLFITLLLEAGLLFVGANTGFLAGPAVLANMAVDSWVPSRFRHLSSRLVIQNGVIFFGISALLLLLWSRGRVSLLVILYSINVFITFSLSLLGLCVFWVKHRRSFPKWKLRFAFSAFACTITTSILCITLFSKFLSGGWITILITCTVIAICLIIKHHYRRVAKKLAHIDKELIHPLSETHLPEVQMDPSQATAVILLGKNEGVAMHTLLSILRIFPRHFKNFIFIHVGIVDVSSFSGQETLEKMRLETNEFLQYFVDYCLQYGIASEAYAAYGTDLVQEITKLSEKVSEKFHNCIFFSSKLVFEKDNWFIRLLHNETAMTVQRQLHLMGKEMVILPVRI